MHDWMKAIPLFAGLSDVDLARLRSEADEVVLESGESLFAEGDAGDRAYVITEGEVEVIKSTGDRDILLSVGRKGEIIGEIGLLLGEPRTAGVRARVPTSFISIRKERFDELLESSPTASKAVFGVLLERWKKTEAKLRQNERMAQLGTLTAGLAHELNNPISAVERGAGQLGEAVADLADVVLAVSTADLSESEMETVTEILAAPPRSRPDLDPLARDDVEAAIEERLREFGVPEPWKVSGDLVEAGFAATDIDALASRVRRESLPPVLSVLNAYQSVRRLLGEVEVGAHRVTDIVGAMKAYVFLDQAPMQEVDVVEGIEDTLVVLGPTLTDIEIVREAPGMEIRIEASGAEMNQVWTSLIENAADAIRETERTDGRITIRIERDRGEVLVEVEDNGTGIPEGIQHRVYDAFFTTKPPGAGPGLGLDMVHGIVVDRHGGDIVLESEPGRTVFRVSLPVVG